jgi:AbrB family looped-hinge helix DNA binding protein
MESEPEITIMGEKGQVVIPKELRKHLGVEPKTRFLVFGSGDLIVLKRLALPDIQKEWEAIFAAADRTGRRFTQKTIHAEISAVRRTRKRKASG